MAGRLGTAAKAGRFNKDRLTPRPSQPMPPAAGIMGQAGGGKGGGSSGRMSGTPGMKAVSLAPVARRGDITHAKFGGGGGYGGAMKQRVKG